MGTLGYTLVALALNVDRYRLPAGATSGLGQPLPAALGLNLVAAR